MIGDRPVAPSVADATPVPSADIDGRKIACGLESGREDKGVDFVLNTAAIAYANEDFDLTQAVLDQLEKEDQEAVKSSGSTSGR